MKATAVCFVFASDSSDKLYQSLLYVDGSTSCDCPGWTRRVQPDGSRFCKHTRLVAAGLAEQQAVKVIRYAEIKRPAMMMLPARAPKIDMAVRQFGSIAPSPSGSPAPPTRRRKPTPAPEPLTRKFDFDA